jgi:hypothetical protein
MSGDLKELLEISIELELLISDLYGLYAELFPEDKDFWWKLSVEEKNHASLLESGRIYLKKGILPEEAVYKNLEVLKEAKNQIQNLISNYKESAPSYEDAYYEAVKIESSAAELHYQLMMTRESDSKIIKIFQSLDGDDTDHAKRISELITQKIKVSNNSS